VGPCYTEHHCSDQYSAFLEGDIIVCNLSLDNYGKVMALLSTMSCLAVTCNCTFPHHIRRSVSLPSKICPRPSQFYLPDIDTGSSLYLNSILASYQADTNTSGTESSSVESDEYNTISTLDELPALATHGYSNLRAPETQPVHPDRVDRVQSLQRGKNTLKRSASQKSAADPTLVSIYHDTNPDKTQ